ncbi:MAG: GAF domain-containing protein [Lachnospiraceae bacterium]|nr:GAF domain-containing protein [Lachnospiraceae bacterium]
MHLQYEDFEKIMDIGISLSTERDRNCLLMTILDKGMEITNCDASTLYLYENDGLKFQFMKTLSQGINRGSDGEPIDLPPVPMKEENVCSYAAIHREVVNIPDVYASSRFDFSGPRQYDGMTGYRTKSQLVVPLVNNENELIGVLQLINAMDEEGGLIAFHESYEIIIRALGAIAAIELTNLSYVEALKAQIYSFVEALTTALEKRTPYNALHTRNVEKYVSLLADYITELHKEGKCDRGFDPERKEQLMLAALIHDIGKMVVPLSIMNKATRLDTRLEKVDDRFALLRALYEIDMLRGRITGEEYEAVIKDLEAELAFVHEMDVIDRVSDENCERIKRLAGKQHVSEDGTALPYLTEKEAECLSIRSGTLTVKERKEMENHVVMTSKILEKVQFYKGFSMVPKWVGAHHEYMDGSGYPNGLNGDELDLETRLLTVVDIYDALVATDRPYKQPISRPRAIQILKDMAQRGKVDLQLVEWLDEALGAEAEDKA